MKKCFVIMAFLCCFFVESSSAFFGTCWPPNQVCCRFQATCNVKKIGIFGDNVVVDFEKGGLVDRCYFSKTEKEKLALLFSAKANGSNVTIYYGQGTPFVYINTTLAEYLLYEIEMN